MKTATAPDLDLWIEDGEVGVRHDSTAYTLVMNGHGRILDTVELGYIEDAESDDPDIQASILWLRAEVERREREGD